MNVGILGTGDVGRAIGSGFVALGHAVKMGARDARNEKALASAQEMGAKAAVGTFADAASFGELVVLATLGVANENAIKMAGLENFRGKVLVDTTNPLDFSGGVPPKLALSGNDNKEILIPELLELGKSLVVLTYPREPHSFAFYSTPARTPRPAVAEDAFEDVNARRYLWYLQRLVEGGFASRMVFRWTSPIRSNRVFQTIVDAPFLSREEQAGMLCGNAARFLRRAASVCAP